MPTPLREHAVNFFGPESAAERYAKGRPFFHPLVARRVSEVLGLDASLARALDVGCGTGLSTAALRELAEQVVGVDASAARKRCRFFSTRPSGTCDAMLECKGAETPD